MRAVFVRHGQSTGNAGVPSHDLASIELTELGWRQAREGEPPAIGNAELVQFVWSEARWNHHIDDKLLTD